MKKAHLLIRRDYPHDPDVDISEQWPGVLEHKFRRWRHLKVWKVSLADAIFTLGIRDGAESTGLADEECMRVTAGNNKADAYATVLHELAHMACMRRDIDNGHGHEWRELFRQAAQTIIRRKIIIDAYSAKEVHETIVKAFAKYIKDKKL